MSFGETFFKKKNGVWHYHPYGKSIGEVNFVVKDGHKEEFEDALNRELTFSIALLPLIVGLGLIHGYLPLILLLLVPFFFLRRRALENKHCQISYRPKFYFFRNYLRIVVPYIDDEIKKKWWVALLLGFLFGLVAFSVYIKDGVSFEFIFLILVVLIFSVLPLILIVLKMISDRKKRKLGSE